MWPFFYSAAVSIISPACIVQQLHPSLPQSYPENIRHFSAPATLMSGRVAAPDPDRFGIANDGNAAFAVIGIGCYCDSNQPGAVVAPLWKCAHFLPKCNAILYYRYYHLAKINMKAIRKASALLITLVGVTSSVFVFAQTQPPPVVAKQSSPTYRCDSSAVGECVFLLYSSACTVGPVKNEHPVLLCTHEFVTEFSLKVGESRVMEGLPANTKQCIAPNGKPSFPDCAR